jgi:RNA polymerase sigma-70 factor (ECF subfamily)
MPTAIACKNASSNAEALTAAIADHTDRLHALAFRMLGDHHAAQDAVQDACLRAFRALDRYRGDASFGTWLYRITANICLDELRRRSRVVMEPSSEKGDDWLVEDDFSQTVVARAELADALTTLPVDLRSALMLTDGMGFSYIDAGAVLGVPVGTVASRVHRAKRSVRTALLAAA